MRIRPSPGQHLQGARPPPRTYTRMCAVGAADDAVVRAPQLTAGRGPRALRPLTAKSPCWKSMMTGRADMALPVSSETVSTWCLWL